MLPDHNATRPPLGSMWRLALGSMAVGACLMGLAWVDVLPGGWTLRGWVQPHSSREARARSDHAQERLELFARENQEAQANSWVFAGSSTIERFPLSDFFEGASTQNRGIGDETCEEFLARLDRSRPLAPVQAWVLYLGSLDFRRLKASPGDTAGRVELILQRIQSADPQASLTLIGILPERDMSLEMVQRLAATNAKLSKLCSRHGVSFVDTARAPLRDPNGSLAPRYASDKLHLNRLGYGVLADWIKQASPRLAR